MKTAIIHSDSYEKHITGDGHPEQPKRVIAIKEKLKKRKDLSWEKPRQSTRGYIRNDTFQGLY